MDINDDTLDVDELMLEIERYLDVVETFRAEGCLVSGCPALRRSA